MKIFFLIIISIIEIKIVDNETINDFECPRDFPLLKKDSAEIECIYENYTSTKHEISNKIIKAQWLNRINQLGVFKTWFFATDLSSESDLIIQSLIYEGSLDTKRYFYGLKKNGRSLYYNSDNNNYVNQITLNSATTVKKFESHLIKIKLSNNDNRDYYLSSGFSNNTIEIIDFYNNKIIGIPQAEICRYSSWASIIFSILDLTNEERTYMFCFIGNNKNDSYIVLQKFKFYDIDISKENSYKLISSTLQKEELKIHNSNIITCIEIYKYNLIQCFYMDRIGYLTIGLFNENSLDLIYSEVIEENITESIENTESDLFFQCIHLKNEISILGYILKKTNPDYIYIQIKEILYNKYYEKYEIENYLLNNRKIIINMENKINFVNNYYLSHLKKINNNKFSLISSSKSKYEIFIIIFDLYNFHDTDLSIRYYSISLLLNNYSIYRYLTSIAFNGFLGIIYTVNIYKTDKRYQKFSLMSYSNSTDSELIILEENNNLKLNDYINNENLENNVFGFYLYGIKIIKLPDSNKSGVYFFSKLKNKIIYENDILSPDDEILFIYDYEDLKIGNDIYTIEIAGIVIEKTFSESLDYTIHYEYYGKNSFESFYKQKYLLGRTSFYNFTIPNNINGINDDSCIENCKVCYNSICIKCKTNYKLIDDLNYCKKEILGKNYYYDKISHVFKKCHDYCETCSNGPIYYIDILGVEDTNCDKCIEEYYKVENTNNCRHKNEELIGYYLNMKEELFKKCYKNCLTCTQIKVNSTYFGCKLCDDNSILYSKSSNCLNCIKKNKYVNYYQYDCIDFIPEGHYLLNENYGILDRCYITCKKCNEKGDLNNHKCIECSEAFPYKYKNGEKCLDDCSKENLLVDIETKICYKDCSNNINDRKCNYKNKCINCNDKPKNYELENNIFKGICLPEEFIFNNDCYYKCPDNTKIDETITKNKICICNNLYYLKEKIRYVLAIIFAPMNILIKI